MLAAYARAQVKGSFAFQQLLFRDAALTQLVERLTGRPAVLAERFNCRSKLPDAGAAANFPWHQDHAFFRLQYLLRRREPRRLLAVWAPLVETVDAAAGGIELAAGSHALGFVRHARAGGFLAAKEAEAKGAMGRAEVPPPPSLSRRGHGLKRYLHARARAHTLPPLSCAAHKVPTLAPGDVLLFTDLTLHRSGANTRAGRVRWSADWAFELQPTDAICPPLESGASQAQPQEPSTYYS